MNGRLATTARGFALMLCAAALLGLAPACGTYPIPLATIPGDDAGDASEAGEASEAAPDVAPRPCATDSDCPGAFCSKCPCFGPTGTCAATPTECPSDMTIVCGSDSVTYFNDCLRHRAGVGLAHTLPCAPSCGGPMSLACPKGTCTILGLGKDSCTSDLLGSCWIVPSTCPSSNGQSFWDACGSGGPHCVDTCTALSEGGVYQIGSQCQQHGPGP